MLIRKLLAVGTLSGGLVASVAGLAAASTSSPAQAARPAAAVHHVKAAASSPSEPEPSGEATSPETDGPGGHQDSGQNADHQYNGTE
jgi:hypothetical protein